jgi:hypothetical protein
LGRATGSSLPDFAVSLAHADVEAHYFPNVKIFSTREKKDEPMHSDPYRRAHERAVADARKRFAAGENVERGVRAEILLSWYRCRDDYRIDPRQVYAPRAEQNFGHSLKSNWALAELTAVGTSLLTEVESLDGVLSITDGAGRVVFARGQRGHLHQAERNNLAPWFVWSERGTGTNGMGTALHERNGILIRRSEHWCEAFQSWSCAGIPITDPTTGRPLAALNVSSWSRSLPDDVLPWLRRSVKGIKEALSEHAARDAALLASSLRNSNRCAEQPLIAFDNGANAIAANEQAGKFIEGSALQIGTDCPELRELVRQGIAQCHRDHTWTGAAEVRHPTKNETMPVTFEPALDANRHVLGLLVALGTSEGETFSPDPPPPVHGPRHPVRVSATDGNRLILLRANQINFATSKGNTIWLSTDGGLLRARDRGLERLERELDGDGFVRVHRNFLVNLNRVREMNYGFRGQLELVMDAKRQTSIPVSKRRAASVRRALAL